MDNQTKYQEGVWVIGFLRAFGTDEQRIAYAILEGMRLQKTLDAQSQKQEWAGA